MDEELKAEVKESAQEQEEIAAESAASEDWRLNRDAAVLAREKLQEKSEQAAEAAEQAEAPAVKAEMAAAPENEKPLSYRERRKKEKEEAAAQKAAQKEEQARRKREAEEEKAQKKRAEQEEKARQKRLAEEEKQRKQYEKKEAKNMVRQERRKEWASLIHTAEFVMLITFIVLAVDQAGVYGFLFVWLFIALMAASIALLLLGIVRAVRRKRCGIIFFVAVVGIIACTGWFIYLISSHGLGLGPIPS